MKKLFCLLLAAIMVLSFCACGGGAQVTISDDTSTSEPENKEPEILNPLTGEADITAEVLALRPVSVMVDNDSNAQRYTQSGVSKADIVYETETEGGITRLMCVFKDVKKAERIGDVRSARYVYVDLALAHNAIMVHCGKDKVFCGPHLNDIDNFEIGTNYYGFREKIKNAFGWQTLFTSGKLLMEGFTKKNWKTADKKPKPWQTFAPKDETVTLTGGAANKITAPFNSSYISYFDYDASIGKYVKGTNKARDNSKKQANIDFSNKARYEFKNVIILRTPMDYYDGAKKYRRKIDLTGGNGYYAVNGTYEPIKWKKGVDADPLTFTKADGTPLTLATGNTWVCIIKDSKDAKFEE